MQPEGCGYQKDWWNEKIYLLFHIPSSICNNSDCPTSPFSHKRCHSRPHTHRGCLLLAEARSYIWDSRGFFFGLLQDLFAFGLFGANSLIKSLIGFSVGTFQKRLVRGNPMGQILLVFFACLFQYWSMYWLKIFFGESRLQVSLFVSIFYPVYNSLLAPLWFWAIEQWEKLWWGGVYAPERNRSAI